MPLDPTAISLHDKAIQLFRSGDHDRALSLLKRALQVDPDQIVLLKSYGEMLREDRQISAALSVFLHILSLDPSDPGVWNAAGICLFETGSTAQAIEYYLRATLIQPNYPEALNNLGVVMLHEKDAAAAIGHFNEAIALYPAYTDAHNNLALAYRAQHDYVRAIATFRAAVALAPQSSALAAGLGEVLSLVYDPEAESVLRHALALDPDNPERHWNLALELLKRGDYLNGWKEHECRWQRTQNQVPLRPFNKPYWRGDVPITNKTLLLHAEQGLGDTLQMLRYLPLLLAQNPAHLYIETQPALTSLVRAWAKTTSSSITVLAYGDPLPSFDWHTPLMSLPHAFRTELATIPPPLRLTPAPTSRAAIPNLRIGLCWAGNPEHGRDRERSLQLELLRPFFALPGFEFVSLQVGPATQQIAASGLTLQQPALTDFVATAEILDTLDLVITVDTAVAHLAGSQGTPTWLLLPYVADWRWLHPPLPGKEAAPNPWYPAIRIFRPPSPPTVPYDSRTAWEPVLRQVTTALLDLQHCFHAHIN